MYRDYNYCVVNQGDHGPLEMHHDPEIPEGYCSVMCQHCGLTTGFPIPKELEWN